MLLKIQNFLKKAEETTISLGVIDIPPIKLAIEDGAANDEIMENISTSLFLNKTGTEIIIHNLEGKFGRYIIPIPWDVSTTYYKGRITRAYLRDKKYWK